MTNFIADLGFDWFAEPNDPTIPTQFELQWGVINVSMSPIAVAAPAFQPGDTVAFNVFDVTSVDSGATSPTGLTVQLGNPWLITVPGDQTQPAGSSLFDQASESAITTATIGQMQGNQGSTFFNSTSLNRWSVMSGTSPLTATVASVSGSNPVCFLLTWTFVVTANGITKTFTVDPEMIVKP